MGTCTSEFGSYEAQALPFRQALHRFPSGVAVVTIAEGTRDHGKTATPLVHGITARLVRNVSLTRRYWPSVSTTQVLCTSCSRAPMESTA